jgi:hypothetical protein
MRGEINASLRKAKILNSYIIVFEACSMHGGYNTSVGKSEGKRPLGRLGRRWKVILKWIINKLNVRVGLNSTSSGEEPVAYPCEHINEPLGPIKGGEFLDWLGDIQLLKDSDVWNC